MEFDDPDLNSDIMRLLWKELKELRGQLQDAKEGPMGSEGSSSSSSRTERVRAVEAENADLKARIRAMELEDAQARSTSAYNTSEKLDVLSEKDKLLKAKDEDNSRLREAVRLYKEKISTERANMAVLQKRLDEAQTQVKQLKLERDQLENRVGPQAGPDNYQKFILSAPRTSRPSEIRACDKELVVQEDTKIMLSMSGYEIVQFNDREIMWSDTISRAIAIRPLHRFHPNGPEGGWEHSFTHKPLTVGRKYVIFYGHKGWSYMGTFECVQCTPLDLEQYKTLPAPIKRYATSRTTPPSGSDPIPASTSKLVEGMYTQGLLKVECLAFKFLSFDGALNKKLLKDSGVLGPSEGTAIRVPGTGIPSKRTAHGDSHHEPQSKKLRARP